MGDFSVAMGVGSVASNVDSVAVGDGSESDGSASVAVGAGSYAQADNSVAVGVGSAAVGQDSVAQGAGAVALADNSVALGAGSVADQDNTVSVGSVGGERRVVNVADGVDATDAVNKGQLDAVAAQVGATDANAVKYDATSKSGITLSGAQGTALHNLAAGEVATDAANTGQVEQALDTAKSYADAGDRQTLARAQAYADQRLANVSLDLASFRREVDDRFRSVNNRVDAVGAMGTAMSQMAFSTQGIDTPNRVGVGVGGYHNQAALAVGFSRQLSSHASLTFGAAISGEETSGGVGLGVGW
jgi:autotransporter adhesin